MNNEFGLIELWHRGDVVIQITAVILLVMSVASWSLILLKLWYLRDFYKAKRMTLDRLISPEALWQIQPHDRSAWECVRVLAAQNRAQGAQEQGLIWFDDMAKSEVIRQTNQLNAGLPILSSIAATAPFIGLFGTVIGIYHTMIGLSQLSGIPNISDVAAPVGETLVMTALGLAVAIPAVIAYNLLLRANRNAGLQLQRYATELKTALSLGHSWIVMRSVFNGLD